MEESEEDLEYQIELLKEDFHQALAASNEESARLEEENALKQQRLLELTREIEKLETPEPTPVLAPPPRMQRRWSFTMTASAPDMNNLNAKSRMPTKKSLGRLSSGNASQANASWGNNTGTQANASWGNNTGTQANASWGTPCPENSPALFDTRVPPPPVRPPRRGSLTSMRRNSKELNYEMMDYLSSIEQESNRAVKQARSELLHQEDQVKALEITVRAQEEEIATLRKRVSKRRESFARNSDEGSTRSLDDKEDQLSEEDLNKRISELSEMKTELETEVRSLKKVQAMDKFETKKAMDLLREEMKESEKKLKSTQKQLKTNQETLGEDQKEQERELHLLDIQLALMDRVSSKTIRRLQKKVASGSSVDDLSKIVQRATRALDEEAALRRSDTTRNIASLAHDTKKAMALAEVPVTCAEELIDALPMLSKDIPKSILESLEVVLSRANESLEVSMDTAARLEDILKSERSPYQKDEGLLPSHLIVSDAAGTHLSTDDEKTQNAAIQPTVTPSRLESLQRELEDRKKQQEGEKKLWDARLSELQKVADDAIQQWDVKDKEFHYKMEEIESLKRRNRKLQETLRSLS